MAAIWGVFGAPSAAVSLHGVTRFAFEVLWFGTGALALAVSGGSLRGTAFFGVFLVAAAVARMRHQQ
jgi:hypothetical protein